jgi:hypothetical protein
MYEQFFRVFAFSYLISILHLFNGDFARILMYSVNTCCGDNHFAGGMGGYCAVG